MNTNNWSNYNIARAITSWGKKYTRNLFPHATGGGCDFVIRPIKVCFGIQHPAYTIIANAVLASEEDCGFSPDRLDEPSTVTLYLDEEWQRGITFSFATAKAAMQWMDALPSEASGFNLNFKD